MSHHNYNYLYSPFSSEFTADFYTFESIVDLVTKCKNDREMHFKCRTIGILESVNGIFYMKDINYGSSHSKNKEVKIQVSMIYLKKPLTFTAMPHTIQLFGILQWERMPIIYANIIQVLASPIALQLREAMHSIVHSHLSKEHKTVEDLC